MHRWVIVLTPPQGALDRFGRPAAEYTIKLNADRVSQATAQAYASGSLLQRLEKSTGVGGWTSNLTEEGAA